MALILRRILPLRALSVFGLSMILAVGVARGESLATAESAATFLSAFRDQGRAVLADMEGGPDHRRVEVRRLLAASFDLPAIGRFVLGKYWRRASLEERAEFNSLFQDHVAAAIARRLDDIEGDVLKVDQARMERPGLAVVGSRVVRTEGAPVKIDWRLHHGKAGWRIIDIVVEGVSLALAQRAEFAGIVRNNGGRVDALLSMLRRAVERDHSHTALDLASSG